MALIYASAVNKRMNAPRQKRSLNDNNKLMETSVCTAPIHNRQRSNGSGNLTQAELAAHCNGAYEGSGRNTRKRSTSQHSGSPCACTPPPNGSGSRRESVDSTHTHRTIARSKTSGLDPKRKFTTIQQPNIRAPPRKISTPPVMTQSVYEPGALSRPRSQKGSLQKSLAKKRIGNKEPAKKEKEEMTACLAISDSSSEANDDSEGTPPPVPPRRQRSLSLEGADLVDDDLVALNGKLSKEKGSTNALKFSPFHKMCAKFHKWKLNVRHAEHQMELKTAN